MLRTSVVVTVAAFFSVAHAPPHHGQSLVSVGGASRYVNEFDLGPGEACPAFPWFSTWLYAVNPPSCPGSPASLGVIASPPTLLGDVAIDRTRNVTFVTDGFVIGEFSEFGGFLGPGSSTNSYVVPTIPTASGTLGPLTGMGFDDRARVLWVTDGAHVAGLAPAPVSSSCQPATLAVSAFAHGLGPGVVLTDLTWSPASASLWACDTAATVHELAVGGGPGPGGPFSTASCVGGATLQGIAFDLASPAAVGGASSRSAPTAYVTDGVTTIAAIDLSTGALAPSTFYDSTPCRPVPAPLNGLAFGGRPMNWSAGTVRAYGYGHATSPTTTLGLVVDLTQPSSLLFLGYGVSTASTGGFFCPSLPVLGTRLHVDVATPPGGIQFVGGASPGGDVVPLALGPGLPTGLQLYAQFFEDRSGVGIGPWVNSPPLVITVIGS